ncbi:hypothetical protein [Nocardiopsis deserti]|uniref:hypothetical protein n=1 Tax=Nocardiopsis deserti TaxID=2605988 RepID=UPI00123AF78E|nr:hypothetical protein [Nocardiopsis deserti]
MKSQARSVIAVVAAVAVAVVLVALALTEVLSVAATLGLGAVLWVGLLVIFVPRKKEGSR